MLGSDSDVPDYKHISVFILEGGKYDGLSKMRYPDAVWDLPELRLPGHSYAEESKWQKSLGPDGPRCRLSRTW